MVDTTVATSEGAPQSVRAEHDASTTLVWAKIWDISSPPPNNTMKGQMMPMFLSRRHRRVSIEVHRIMIGDPETRKTKSADQLQEGVDYYEECVVRILSPIKKKKMALKKLVPNGETSTDEPTAAHDDSDDESVAESVFADDGIEDTPDYSGWKVKYRLPIDCLSIRKVHKKNVYVTVQHRAIKQNRDIIFHSEEEAQQFIEMIAVQKEAGERRASAKLQGAMKGLNVDKKEEITLLIEIVSGWDLPASDLTSSDPYVVCFMRGVEVHRTKHISKTLDPIWTIKTGALFLLKLTTEELFTSNGLVCEVMDFDKFGANDKLGLFTVPPKVLFEAKGERLEFDLKPSKGATHVSGGIAIRCRHATDYDIEFMNDYDSSKKKQKLTVHEMIKKAEQTKGGKGGLRSVVTVTSKTERHGPNKGETVYLVRPGPDPTRKEETTWMTEPQIDEEVLKESQNWLDAGSGDLGRIYLEVLECEGLPNLDAGGFLGNKTDTFVTAVYEDTIVKTDVIDDCLSPRWLPWSNRAFVFHMMSSSSPLYLGVFDYDPGIGDDHDLIGRVAIDLTNMHKNTTFVLKYDIFPTAKLTDRVKQGSIKIRLRLEVDDERKLLLSALEPPPIVYVNCKSRKDWATVRYTCQGKVDTSLYSMKVINSYVEELLSYQHLVYYIQDAVMAVLLWKGHFECTILGHDIKLPLHSMNAFITLTILVEHPRLVPCFFFASIGWLLIAVMGWRRRSPDPWSRCKPYREFAETLALGHSMAAPPSIEPYENAEEAAKFQQKMQQRIIDAEEAARIAYQKQQKEQEEEMADIQGVGGDTDISTKQGSGIVSSIDVFKPFLFPIQQYLDLAVGYLRIVRNVLVWEEAYISFWVATGCFGLAVIFFFLPWVFLLHWTARIIVWVAFGPWMKLVDVFYVSKIKPLSEDEEAEKQRQAEMLRRLKRKDKVKEARIQKEDTTKLKAMKKIMFGKFVTRVPVIKQDRHQDFPLAESSATPYTPKEHSLAELAMKEAGYHRTRLPGQHLVGNMIPRMETASFTEAPTGAATKDPSLLSKNTPGANPSKDSDIAAYAKIGAVVGTAGLVTWFGVPVLSAAAEKLFGK